MRLFQHWATEVESSVYVTPVIFDVASDGVKVVLAALVHLVLAAPQNVHTFGLFTGCGCPYIHPTC